MNVIAQPGGLISDKIGSRKWTLTALLACMGISYLVYSKLVGNIALPSHHDHNGRLLCDGITRCNLRQHQRRVTGQIGGNAAAYGNVGSVAFLTVYSLYLRGLWETGSFQMQVVALIVASFVPSSRNRKAR